jgi:broad specificity phosphatase PhoE
VVCHAGVIAASIKVFFGIPDSKTGARLRPVNTGLTEWEYDPALKRWLLQSFNERAHLLEMVSAGDG